MTFSAKAVRYLAGRAGPRRLVGMPSRLGYPSSSRLLVARPFASAPIDRVVVGSLDKEFPGYFDSLHHRGGKGMEGLLDVHDHRKDLEDASDSAAMAEMMTNEKVRKIIELNHAVDECVVIDINVEQHGEIPVAFVVKKLGSEGQDEELHAQLINALRLTVGHAGKHQELERDLIKKLDTLWENDDEIKDDLIRDELVNMVRDKFGPYAILKVVIVDDLPRTICGRVLRGTLYKIARGQPYSITPMIEDRQVLAALEKEIHGLLGAQYQD